MNKKNKYEYWRIAIRKHSDDIAGNKEPFRVLKNPFGYWAADPFIAEKDGLYYVFAELCDKNAGRGKIGVLVIDENGKTKKRWKVIMDNGHHMSFPNVFCRDGEYYMMPESNLVNKLSLFRVVEFPYKWEETVLIDGERFCDSVFLEDDVILSYNDFSDDKSQIILGCKDGVFEKIGETPDRDRKLRPAGKVISEKDGVYLIPLQDCGEYYGRAILFTELRPGIGDGDAEAKVVFELNSENVKTVGYKSKLCGMHTYNYDGNLEIIDLKSYEFSFTIWFRKKRAEIRGFVMRAGSKIKRTLLPKRK
ncbi:MAG: hypothetical protein MJ137_07005 [Clostridia bacterium]|nr:hypothetical protein [Clostridia bacterium]